MCMLLGMVQEEREIGDVKEETVARASPVE